MHHGSTTPPSLETRDGGFSWQQHPSHLCFLGLLNVQHSTSGCVAKFRTRLRIAEVLDLTLQHRSTAFLEFVSCLHFISTYFQFTTPSIAAHFWVGHRPPLRVPLDLSKRGTALHCTWLSTHMPTTLPLFSSQHFCNVTLQGLPFIHIYSALAHLIFFSLTFPPNFLFPKCRHTQLLDY